VVHEFLLASTLRRVVTHLAQRQGLYKSAEPGSDDARVLESFGALRDPLTAAVREPLPEIARRCGLGPFEGADLEMRVVSRSNGLPPPAHDRVADDRALGFVLFLHREPRRFEGGELHLHGASGESIIEPSQNSMIFFHGSIAARIGAVHPASGALIDSLLTLEGWVRD
jgi:hypothetical protein